MYTFGNSGTHKDDETKIKEILEKKMKSPLYSLKLSEPERDTV